MYAIPCIDTGHYVPLQYALCSLILSNRAVPSPLGSKTGRRTAAPHALIRQFRRSVPLTNSSPATTGHCLRLLAIRLQGLPTLGKGCRFLTIQSMSQWQL